MLYLSLGQLVYAIEKEAEGEREIQEDERGEMDEIRIREGSSVDIATSNLPDRWHTFAMLSNQNLVVLSFRIVKKKI